MLKTAIYGGSFDPPHIGHTETAKAVIKELKLGLIIIVPAAKHPLKGNANVSFADRAEMCRLAFSDCPNCIISETENDIKGKNYTVKTIAAIKNKFTENIKPYLIIGSDGLFNFTSWYKYEEILEECRVTAVPREKNIYADMTECAAQIGKIKVLNLPVTEISSSEIREKIKNNENIAEFVSGKVREYIKEKGLYL